MEIWPIYDASLTLVGMLHKTQTQDIFARACRLLSQRIDCFPVVFYLLGFLKMFTERMGLPIPEQLAACFDEIRWMQEWGLSEPPISFVLPGHAETLKRVDDHSARTDGFGLQMGALVASWCQLSE
ncbi:MAG: hypothetical protein M1821_005923 [Bathelium mastoideum]|nr:MAG: hypothetical protein M1821_005923 [Bathelium mastoideum]